MTSLRFASYGSPIKFDITYREIQRQHHHLLRRFSTLGLDNSNMSDMPILSQSAKDLLVKVRMIVPPMLGKFHKGK